MSTFRRHTDEITLLCSDLSREVKGALKPYSRYYFTEQASRVVTNDIVTGCEDVFCDTYDDDGNVVGEHKCGVKNIVTPQIHTIDGWQPGLGSNYFYSSNSMIKPKGQTELLITMPVLPDPFKDIRPSTIKSENYSCDARLFNYGFGLWCYGTVGHTKEFQLCAATIPPCRLEYEIKPVLLEAQFDYCP